MLTVAMPKEVTTFTRLDGVWVTNYPYLAGVATALRASVIGVASSKRALEGRHGKMELLYNYLASQEFKQRIEGIVEAFVTMKTDLDAEKRAIQRTWAKREKHLERALVNVAGMHGDLTGIIGAGIPAVEGLALPALTDASSDSESP